MTAYDPLSLLGPLDPAGPAPDARSGRALRDLERILTTAPGEPLPAAAPASPSARRRTRRGLVLTGAAAVGPAP